MDLKRFIHFLIAVVISAGILLWIWVNDWKWFATGILIAFVLSVIVGVDKKPGNDRTR